MDFAHLPETELEETFARSSGPGGQHVNKVSSAVTLRHRVSGLSVTVQDSRSQAANRRLARVRLAEAVRARAEKERRTSRAARERARRQSSPRPRKLKEKILESKRLRSEIKRTRARVQ